MRHVAILAEIHALFNKWNKSVSKFQQKVFAIVPGVEIRYTSGMKFTIPIQKSTAEKLLGGTPKLAAKALRYKTVQGYYKLPETLSERDSLAVLGAVFLQQQRQPRPTVTCVWGDGLTKLVRGGRSA